jgi:hypothetical protein
MAGCEGRPSRAARAGCEGCLSRGARAGCEGRPYRAAMAGCEGRPSRADEDGHGREGLDKHRQYRAGWIVAGQG